VNGIAPHGSAQEEPDRTTGAAEGVVTMLAVPNFSEGRDGDVITALTDSCRVPGVDVLDRHADPDHNRTVLSIAGTPQGLCDALVRLAAAACARIDLRWHQGVHPCTGALDVVPIVVLDEADASLARAIAHTVAARIGDELDVPVFFYGQIATRPELRRPYGRRGCIRAPGASWSGCVLR